MVDSQENDRGRRKERQGVVVSRSGNKSVVVQVERRFPHPQYAKEIRETRKFHAHDEKNETGVGDKVLIVETRPMSRLKRWRVTSVTQKAAKKPDGA
jgi:small subunit ribosomal protein S17